MINGSIVEHMSNDCRTLVDEPGIACLDCLDGTSNLKLQPRSSLLACGHWSSACLVRGPVRHVGSRGVCIEFAPALALLGGYLGHRPKGQRSECPAAACPRLFSPNLAFLQLSLNLHYP